MRFLDRDDHPVRFAVTTSVVSGLMLTIILSTVGAMTRNGLLTWSVPLWLLIASVVAITCLSVVATGGRGRTMRMFLIIPAFSQKHWVSELMHNTHRALDRRGTEMVLKIPDKDYSATGQTHHLRGILTHRSQYVGGLIVPVELESLRDDLLSFCAKFARPVVMMDVEPFDDERDYPRNAAFVGYSAAAIGECAADWVVGQLAVMAENEPNILVVGSRDQCGRQRRFTEIIKKKVPKARVILYDDGEFIRKRAWEAVGSCLWKLSAEGLEPTIVFCTNDELALGAVDALLANQVTSVPVIGVDGTAEAKALIDTRKSPLRATVVQDSYCLSEKAIDLFERMRDGERVPVRTFLPPKLYVAEGVG